MACDKRSLDAGEHLQSLLRATTIATAAAHAIETTSARISNDLNGRPTEFSDRPVQPATKGSMSGETAGHGSGPMPSRAKTTAMVFPKTEGKDACRGPAPFWPGSSVLCGAIDAPHPKDERRATDESAATATFFLKK